jgi:site-specific DNA-methyltransferase (adenine-specific)
VAAEMLNRKAFGFEIEKKFHQDGVKWIEKERQNRADEKEFGFRKSEQEKAAGFMTLWGQK